MAMTAAQLAVARSHVGATPDDANLNARYDRLLSVAAVALEVLRERLSNFTSGYGSVSVAGHFSGSVSAEQLVTLRQKIATLEAELAGESGDVGGVLGVVQLVRPDPSR